ncbi:hypothetical protein GCM10027276_08630 [Comamonas piscis]
MPLQTPKAGALGFSATPRLPGLLQPRTTALQMCLSFQIRLASKGSRSGKQAEQPPINQPARP